ncbi:unnamed protein product, partial [Effrenium voratum]
VRRLASRRTGSLALACARLGVNLRPLSSGVIEGPRGAVHKFDEIRIALPGARAHGCQPPAAVNNDMCRRLRFRGVLARDAGLVGAPVRKTRRWMKARLAAPSCQLVVMFRGPPASYAHRACPVMAQRTGNIAGAARLDAELRQTAKMEDVPRANWQGHRACSVMAVR